MDTRERQSPSWGGAETQNLKQTPGSEQSAQSHMGPPCNPLSHPGTPGKTVIRGTKDFPNAGQFHTIFFSPLITLTADEKSNSLHMPNFTTFTP